LTVNDKLVSLIRSIPFGKSSRKPNSPLNKETYNPKQALANLQLALNGGSELITPIKEAKYKQDGTTFNSQDYIVQKDPYTSTNKIQFEENTRAEPMTKAALMKMMDFMFAKGMRSVLDTVEDDFATTDEKKKAVESVMSNQEFLNAKKVVDKINRRVNFRYNARIAVFNAKAFGRSALLKDYVDSPDDYPQCLYPLNSKLMGNVFLDKRNNQIAYLEYNSNDTSDYNNKIYYEPDDLIYFTNFDYNISPNTLGYGLSEIESIKDIGETNRVINEEDNKEFARLLWAGNILFTLPNLHNSTEVENLLTNYDPGKPVAITSDIGATPLETPQHLAEVTDLNIQNDRRILRGTSIPQPLFFEDVTNRATVQFILHAWKESFVEQQRIWFKDIVEKQWILPIWMNELGITDMEEMEALDAKLTIEFIEYNFDTFEQKVASLLPIVQAGYISVERFLEELGYPQWAEEYKQIKVELQQQKLDYMQQQFQMQNKFGIGIKPGFQKGFSTGKSSSDLGGGTTDSKSSGGGSSGNL